LTNIGIQRLGEKVPESVINLSRDSRTEIGQLLQEVLEVRWRVRQFIDPGTIVGEGMID
jgi:hypothetical protein